MAMNKIVEGVLVLVAVGMILLGMIFVIASGIENLATGLVMILVAALILYYIYRSTKIEAAKPTLVSQTFNVKMDGSGKFNEKGMTCRSCGAPITDKSIKVVEGGLMVTCPYCNAVYAFEEQPKW